jgi:glycosyltransferase involved in cell wall biosynthesis
MSSDRERRPRVGVALYGDVTYDSRVRREAATLARSGYDVRLVCLASSGADGDLPDQVTTLVRLPAAGSVLPGAQNPFWAERQRRRAEVVGRIRWLSGYASSIRAWGRLAIAAAGTVDVWHVHDLPALIALGPVVPRAVPIVFDAHELFVEAGTAARMPGPLRSLLRAYERRLVSRVAAIVTVNEALGAVLRGRYPGRRVVVLHNCPDRWAPPLVLSDRIREAAGIPIDSPVILHHGSLGANRGIEQLLEALEQPGLEGAHVVLMGPGEVRAKYVEIAASPRWHGRVHVLNPVASGDLLDWVASADVGAMPIQRSTLNHFLSTPNKLFECIAAGVPVVASDFPAMRQIVAGDGDGALGQVCDPTSVESIASALRSVLSLDPVAYDSMRARCLAAAHRRWNWETEAAKLTALYGELVGRQP